MRAKMITKKLAILAVLLLVLWVYPEDIIRGDDWDNDRDREDVHESTFEKSYRFSSGGKLSIKNANGSIYVNAWDKEEVKVIAKKRIKAASHEMAEEASREVKIEVEQHGNDMDISVYNPYRRSGKGSSEFLAGHRVQVSINYDLYVPKDIYLRAQTANGNIEVEGIEKETEVTTVNGSIEVEDVRGTVLVDTVNGSIEAGVAGADMSDEIKLKTVNGGIKLYLDEDIKADIKASLVNGKISTEFDIETRESSKKKLRGEINGGGTRIDIETVNGSIRILKN